MRWAWLSTLVVPLAALRVVACSSSPSTPDGGSDASSEAAVTTPAPQQGLRWAKELGHAAFVRDVGVDGAGDIWIAGRFGGPSLDIDTTSVPCAQTHCAFVAKFSPTGDVLLAQTLAAGTDVTALAVSQSAVFAAVDQPAQADAGPLASASHVVLELDLQGQVVDARTMATLPTDISTHATTLVADPSAPNAYFFSELAGGKAVRVGTLDGSVLDFDAGSGSGVLLHTFGANPFEWGTSIGGTPNDLSTARGATGGVLLTGQFPSATLDQSPPAIGSLLFDGGKQTGFVAQVDPNGAPAYLENLGGGQPHGVTALANGDLVIVGEVTGDVFVGGVPVTNLGHVNNPLPFFLEVDSSGKIVRVSTYGSSVLGVFERVIAAAAGGTIVTGSGIALLPQGKLEGDEFVVRFDAQGAPLWSRSFNNLGGRLHVADTTSGPVVVGTSIGAIDLSPILTDVRDAGDAAIFIAALQP